MLENKTQLNHFFNELNHICTADKYKIKKLLIKFQKNNQLTNTNLTKINALIDQAKLKFNKRKAHIPQKIDYPALLPVIEKKNDILSIIKNNQVVILVGETGSGKTTQIPKLCVELGLGAKGLIGLTQPRRLAARSVSKRIAEELKTEIGSKVGFKIRFTDHVSDSTLIKVMTDGILLAEIQNDPLLSEYETIIIDEAHERSLNIDFIIGYLRNLIQKRDDLKVIITSATIDLERFSQHFNNAPIIEISGRTYPVEVRYRPLIEQIDLFQGIVNAIDELSVTDNRGDILVFLSGEKEIHDLADSLKKQNFLHTEIIPLYARLATSAQNKIFESHQGRRIILSTNVAETSVTVPGIKYVIDSGIARISRYNYKNKVQQLFLEPISKASANQRKGRCGRTSDGICIRLYDEQDFLSRDDFTIPEILRSNLAAVILQMISLNLGDISSFPFIQSPDPKYIKDGFKLLEELSAIEFKNNKYRLTEIGLTLSKLPIEPRFARMLYQANKLSCVKEIMIITAGLSIQDPRERPFDKKQQSDEKHQRFVNKQSDFLTLINLWQYIKEQQALLSNTAFRQLCKKEFLNYLRIKEWQDIYTQIKLIVRQLDLTINQKFADYQNLHTAIATGILSNIGMKSLNSNEYIGARNNKFMIFPSSAVFKTKPKWCLTSELVETTKLWGRNVAMIEPHWLESIARHLIKKSYNEPRWSKKQGTTVASLKLTLYGLPIVNNRLVTYNKIDPTLSRMLLIKEALIAGEIIQKPSFLIKNEQLIEEVIEIEQRLRKKDILIDEAQLFEFYDAQIPQQITCIAELNHWFKKEQKIKFNLLLITKEQLFRTQDYKKHINAFPDYWIYNDLIKLKLEYTFNIGNERDGVTVIIPICILNQIENTFVFDWQVDGFRRDLIIALIKTLPKSLRRNLVPAPNYADAFLERVKPYQTALLLSLEQEFKKITGITIEREQWNLTEIPNHLKINFNIIDENNKTIILGTDLTSIKQNLSNKINNLITQISKQNDDIEKKALSKWDFGDIPKIYEKKQQNLIIKAYPTLVDEGKTVSIQLVNTIEMQQEFMLKGIRKLIYINLPASIKDIQTQINTNTKLIFVGLKLGTLKEYIDDILFCSIDHLIIENSGIIFEQDKFLPLLDKIKANIFNIINDVIVISDELLKQYNLINKQLKSKISLEISLSIADVKRHLNELIYKGFLTQTGFSKLTSLKRYLSAISKRLEKLPQNPNKDRLNLLIIENVRKNYQSLLSNSKIKDKQQIQEVRWMIEELYVNLFAQQLGTAYPISEKRIYQHIDKIINN